MRIKKSTAAPGDGSPDPDPGVRKSEPNVSSRTPGTLGLAPLGAGGPFIQEAEVGFWIAMLSQSRGEHASNLPPGRIVRLVSPEARYFCEKPARVDPPGVLRERGERDAKICGLPGSRSPDVLFDSNAQCIHTCMSRMSTPRAEHASSSHLQQ